MQCEGKYTIFSAQIAGRQRIVPTRLGSADLHQTPTASAQLSNHYLHTEPAKVSFCTGTLITFLFATASRKQAFYKNKNTVCM